MTGRDRRSRFTERGFRGTSVRAITDLAGVNLAGVGYHFGSKAQLVAAVVRRVIEPITAAQSAGLDRLLAATPDPTVAELVEAFAGPLFDQMPPGDQGRARTSRLIMTIISDPAEEMRAWTGPAEDGGGDVWSRRRSAERQGIGSGVISPGCFGWVSRQKLPDGSRNAASTP